MAPIAVPGVRPSPTKFIFLAHNGCFSFAEDQRNPVLNNITPAGKQQTPHARRRTQYTFYGVGESCYGSYHGIYGSLAFSHQCTVPRCRHGGIKHGASRICRAILGILISYWSRMGWGSTGVRGYSIRRWERMVFFGGFG